MPIVTPTEGETVELGGLGVRFMATGEGFSIVEHPIAPRTLAAPMHLHEHEVPDFEGLAALQARYGLTMDMDTAATISEREGLTIPS